MEASEVPRAVAAATTIAVALGLAVDEAVILHDSNRLTLRLLPCDVLARVAQAGHRTASFEVEVAQRLAETDCPVAALEQRVEPQVYEMDGFDVTLWTYEPPAPQGVSPGDYAAPSSGCTTSCGRSTFRRRTTRIESRRRCRSSSSSTAVPRSRTPTGGCSAPRCDARYEPSTPRPPSNRSCTASRTRATC